MGSFNFKDTSVYSEINRAFIQNQSKTILPLHCSFPLTPTDPTIQQLSSEFTSIKDVNVFPFSSICSMKIYSTNNQHSFSLGTCVLISPKIFMTCAHNVINRKTKQYFNKVDILINYQGKKNIDLKLDHNNCRIPKEYCSFGVGFQKYDLALLFIQEEYDDQIGCMQIGESHQEQPLYLFGYPSTQPINQSIKLFAARGNLLKYERGILKYSFRTEAGQSGSPILVHSQKGWGIVGIHIIGEGLNQSASGVHIDEGVRNWMNQQINIKQSLFSLNNKGDSILKGKQLNLNKMVQKYDWELLIELRLSSCGITTKGLLPLNRINWNVKICILDNNKIDQICLQSGKFKKLQKLELSNNCIKVVKNSIKYFKRLKQVYLSSLMSIQKTTKYRQWRHSVQTCKYISVLLDLLS